jgi:hypothetical protein
MNIKMKKCQGEINISYKRIIRRGSMPPDPLPVRLSNSILLLCTSQILNKLIHMQNAFTVFIVE